MNLAPQSKLPQSGTNNFGLEPIPGVSKQRILGDTVQVACDQGGVVSCSLGDDGCVPGGSACPSRPIPRTEGQPGWMCEATELSFIQHRASGCMSACIREVSERERLISGTQKKHSRPF